MRIGNTTIIWFKDIKYNGISRVHYMNSRSRIHIGLSIYLGLYVLRIDYTKKKKNGIYRRRNYK